ncbi:MAG: hypothetical protein WBV82_00290 [Myxococcaceae bacterium]
MKTTNETLREATLALAAAAALVMGCTGGSPGATVSAPPTPKEDVTKPGEPGEELPKEQGEVCDQGRVYKGLGDRVLVAGRTEQLQNVDRSRIKPYSALAGEYERVLGEAPALLGSMASTFSSPPARWYEEPGASAVTLYSSYRVAFVGCLDLTATATEYAEAPNAESARAACESMAKKFWNRAPTSDELNACVSVATVDTQAEKDARRRWAYTCASVLNSAGFITF